MQLEYILESTGFADGLVDRGDGIQSCSQSFRVGEDGIHLNGEH